VFDRGGGVDNGGLFRCGISYEFVTNSEFFGFSDSDATSGPGTNMQTINLGAIAGGDYYYGYCVIPKVVSGWSHLVSWKVVEN
jgi:hypothetical protein